ncbi:ABC transporter substrate-binding protein [Helicobacter sp. 11S02629-2]|uniref:ABC transporter substrate-binding protein n=1 Tax=Helicobacter sp. 11S02629-2 TaxID=1476195 RepID=UPI000BDD5804|nr:ABC transporter substrate-binding protein [Helicobacter sp. 11S02629-2]PAF45630.1 hypothetical protein BKH40_01750 [Helicobacter sp. 11S02629-2]
MFMSMRVRIFFLSSFFLLLCSPFLKADSLTLHNEKVIKAFAKAPPKNMGFIGVYAEIPALFDNWDKVKGLGSYGFSSDLVKASLKNQKLVRFSDSHSEALNAELLIKLDMNFLVLYGGAPKLDYLYDKLHINTYLTNWSSVEDVMSDIKNFGSIFHEEQKTKDFLDESNAIYHLIDSKTKGLKKPRVAYIFREVNIVSGRGGLDSSILKYAKVNNIALPYVASNRGYIELERLIKLDPDYIFIWWISALSPSDLYKDKRLRDMKAIKERHVFRMPGIDLGGPRMALISLFVASKTYPSAFKDVDLKALERSYYDKLFPNIDRSKIHYIFN